MMLWAWWLRVTHAIGIGQMVIILSLLYWGVCSLLALPLRIFSDPMALRRSSGPTWIKRDDSADSVDAMRQQY